jgi:hypothetical protein
MRLQGMAVLDSKALPIAARGAYQRSYYMSPSQGPGRVSYSTSPALSNVSTLLQLCLLYRMIKPKVVILISASGNVVLTFAMVVPRKTSCLFPSAYENAGGREIYTALQ